MYGWIHQSIRDFMINLKGEPFWMQVCERAGIEYGKEAIQNHNYPDAETLRIIDGVSVLGGFTYDEVFQCYGRHLVTYLIKIGWDKLLISMSPDLKGFLECLDSLHYFSDHIVFKTKLRGPLFRVDENDNGSLTLHYISDRIGCWGIVYGCVTEAAPKLFNMEVKMTMINRNQRIMQTDQGEKLKDHVVFLIEPKDGSSLGSRPHDADTQHNGILRVSSLNFMKLFPYHLIVDNECCIRHYGLALPHHISVAVLDLHPPFSKLFRVYRPQVPIDFDTLVKFRDAVWVTEIRPVHIMTNIIHPEDEKYDRKSIGSLGSMSNVSNLTTASTLKLKGQMFVLKDGKHIVYLCSPHVHTVKELFHYNLHINALPLHDQTRDIILLNHHKQQEVEMARKLKETEDNLESMANDIEEAKKKAENLLREVLPASVAEQLKQGKTVNACEYPEVTLMFTDVPNFGEIVQNTHPRDIVYLLNQLFTQFDRLVILHDVYKVETVGDCYLVAGGVPVITKDHCELVCNVALGMLWEASYVIDPITHQVLVVRVGIHTGSIVAGVVGTKMPRFCLFGDAVNTASRMESHGLPGKIHCSQSAYEAANKTGRFHFESRGAIQVKGKGEMTTYFLTGSEKHSLWDLIEKPRDENINSIEGYQELTKIAPSDSVTIHNHNSMNHKLSRLDTRDFIQKDSKKSKICRLM